MLCNDAREGLVEGYEQTRNAAMIAETYGVLEWQVYNLMDNVIQELKTNETIGKMIE